MLTEKNLPKEFIKFCRAVTAKRPRTVIDHLLKHGQITSEELKTIYGYNHPPRAVRDVKEQSIPIERFSVLGSDGRRIAAYRFADPKLVPVRKFEGRTGLSKRLKTALIARYGCRCFIYLEVMPQAELQIDHRVPYEIAGETTTMEPEEFMLLCGSANRAKSWSCEHCDNFLIKHRPAICKACFWASPENYSHIAETLSRRIELVWSGGEVADFERLKHQAEASGLELATYIKRMLSE